MLRRRSKENVRAESSETFAGGGVDGGLMSKEEVDEALRWWAAMLV